MADALVSIVMNRLASVIEEQIRHQVSVVAGVKTKVESLTNTLHTIRAVLADAEKRQVKEESVRLWLEKLRDMTYQMHDLLDEWSAAIVKPQIVEVAEEGENASMPKKKVSSCFPFSGIPFKQAVKQVASRRDIALRIESIKQQLDVIANERIQFSFSSSDRSDQSYRLITTSGIDISEVYGRDADKETILNKLLGHESVELLVISIVGMGGIGKTTLAQLAYNYQEVKAHFDERIWACVSHPFEPKRVYRAIAESLQNMPCNFHDLEALQGTIQKCISRKKFLLVLDDVWTEDYQLLGQLRNCLKLGAEGSSILVTTRNVGVAEMMETTYIYPLGPLSQEQSLSLFNRIAFSGRNADKIEELGEIGGEIASKCGGLPLALKTIGSLLRMKDNKEAWESILNNEVWQMDVIGEHLSPPLLLSYYDLPPPIKRCFSFCATFPKDEVIVKANLIRLWMAHSYLNSKTSIDMETIGQDYFHVLVSRSFFQDFEKDESGNIIRCKMHDIIHDLAQFLTTNECLMMHVEDDTRVRIEPPSKMGHHATLFGALYSSTPDMEKLHTLLIRHGGRSRAASDNMFQYLACLRALELSRNNSIEEFPRGLGNLMHLRFLNLSRCRSLRKLPEEICGLHNLQTLDVSHCNNLGKLPEGMGKLINLRHLVNEETHFRLPKGFGRLASLRTLTKLILSNDDENACSIGELRNLNNLTGELEILWLFDRKIGSEDAEAAEAEKAQLKNKKHLRHLTLISVRKSVIDALQPHPNLKSLELWSYEADKCPSWVMNSCLPQLKRLQLAGGGCKIRTMPPFGELPLLQILQISSIPKLKYIGDEFLGSLTMTSFPKLKTLVFSDLEEWEEWQVKEGNRSVMPCLRYFEVSYCRKLKSLPDCLLRSTTLEELKIYYCPLLQRRQ